MGGYTQTVVLKTSGSPANLLPGSSGRSRRWTRLPTYQCSRWSRRSTARSGGPGCRAR
jgi:hypothetical protein